MWKYLFCVLAFSAHFPPSKGLHLECRPSYGHFFGNAEEDDRGCCLSELEESRCNQVNVNKANVRRQLLNTQRSLMSKNVSDPKCPHSEAVFSAPIFGLSAWSSEFYAIDQRDDALQIVQQSFCREECCVGNDVCKQVYDSIEMNIKDSVTMAIVRRKIFVGVGCDYGDGSLPNRVRRDAESSPSSSTTISTTSEQTQMTESTSSAHAPTISSTTSKQSSTDSSTTLDHSSTNSSTDSDLSPLNSSDLSPMENSTPPDLAPTISSTTSQPSSMNSSTTSEYTPSSTASTTSLPDQSTKGVFPTFSGQKNSEISSNATQMPGTATSPEQTTVGTPATTVTIKTTTGHDFETKNTSSAILETSKSTAASSQSQPTTYTTPGSISLSSERTSISTTTSKNLLNTTGQLLATNFPSTTSNTAEVGNVHNETVTSSPLTATSPEQTTVGTPATTVTIKMTTGHDFETKNTSSAILETSKSTVASSQSQPTTYVTTPGSISLSSERTNVSTTTSKNLLNTTGQSLATNLPSTTSNTAEVIIVHNATVTSSSLMRDVTSASPINGSAQAITGSTRESTASPPPLQLSSSFPKEPNASTGSVATSTSHSTYENKPSGVAEQTNPISNASYSTQNIKVPDLTTPKSSSTSNVTTNSSLESATTPSTVGSRGTLSTTPLTVISTESQNSSTKSDQSLSTPSPTVTTSRLPSSLSANLSVTESPRPSQGNFSSPLTKTKDPLPDVRNDTLAIQSTSRPQNNPGNGTTATTVKIHQKTKTFNSSIENEEYEDDVYGSQGPEADDMQRLDHNGAIAVQPLSLGIQNWQKQTSIPAGYLQRPGVGIEDPVNHNDLSKETADVMAAPQYKQKRNRGIITFYRDCVGIPLHNPEDHPCVFPFIYLGKVHTACTTMEDHLPWCATAVDSNQHLVTNDWGYCTAGCPIETRTCKTVVGGPIVNVFCRFPFRYKGVQYHTCTTVDDPVGPWCATQVDAHGDYMPDFWGRCECPDALNTTAVGGRSGIEEPVDGNPYIGPEGESAKDVVDEYGQNFFEDSQKSMDHQVVKNPFNSLPFETSTDGKGNIFLVTKQPQYYVNVETASGYKDRAGVINTSQRPNYLTTQRAKTTSRSNWQYQTFTDAPGTFPFTLPQTTVRSIPIYTTTPQTATLASYQEPSKYGPQGYGPATTQKNYGFENTSEKSSRITTQSTTFPTSTYKLQPSTTPWYLARPTTEPPSKSSRGVDLGGWFVPLQTTITSTSTTTTTKTTTLSPIRMMSLRQRRPPTSKDLPPQGTLATYIPSFLNDTILEEFLSKYGLNLRAFEVPSKV